MTMDVRFVAIWTALSVAARALLFALGSMAWIRQSHSIMLLSAAAIAAAPIAQALALRTTGVRWGLEWAVAGIASGVFVRAGFDILSMIGVTPGGATVLLYMLAIAATVAFLQLIVLRRHGARAAPWLAAAAAVWAIERAAQWLISGDAVPGPSTSPMSRPLALSLTAATALVQGLVLARFVLRPPAGPRRAAGSGWVLVEWTAAGAVAVLLVIGSAGLIETALRDRPRIGLTLGRPLFAVVAGLVIGGLQWLLLRRHLALPRAWMVASGSAHGAPALASALAAWTPASRVPEAALFTSFAWVMLLSEWWGLAAIGAWLGFWQWLVLRRHARRAFIWIPATAAAWSLFRLTDLPIYVSSVMLGVAAGAIMAAAVVALRAPQADPQPYV